LIAVAVVVVVAGVVLQASRQRRTGRLQEQFGPEYDRTVDTAESKREAEVELQEREERRRELDIRPLSQAARDRYIERWQSVQAEFVDNPGAAVARADDLIQSVMAERGYPVEDFEQRAADVSVDHPDVVENYRHGHRLAQSSADGEGSTEDLRQAMRHYRALFEELVEPEPDADRPTARERHGVQPGEATDRDPSEERTAR
jgi:hypothetical protein